MKLIIGCCCDECGDEIVIECEVELIEGRGYDIPTLYCDCGAEVWPIEVIKAE